MTDPLPAHINLEQLRNRTGDLCRAVDARDEYAIARVCAVFPQFDLTQKLKRADAYFIVAREHGYPSWPQMKLAVNQASTAPTPFVARMTRADALKFKGNGMVDDSMSLAVVALANFYGRTTTYADAGGLLGSAFAPAVDLEEDCLSHACVNGAFAEPGLALACRALGFSLTQIPAPSPSDSARESTLQAIGEALDAGDAVLAGGGWRFSFAGLRGFVHWAWAGFVTDVEPDGTVVGACLNGQIDNPLEHLSGVHYVGRLWRISPQPVTPQMLPHRAILQQALARLLNQPPYAGQHPTYRYGLSAMDEWMHKMAEVPGFCAPCHGRTPGAGRGDALTHAKRMARSSRTASDFLLHHLNEFPHHARPILQQAAQRYAAIAERLEHTINLQDTPDAYTAILGDLARQKDHVNAVLAPTRADLEAIASMLTQALHAWPHDDAPAMPAPV